MESEDIAQLESGNGPPSFVASEQTLAPEAEALEDGEDASFGPSDVDVARAGAPAAGTNSLRRTLKLVLTLRPADGPGYQAILALGADGCDPLWRSASVADLPAALDEVPALAAEAEARWQAQPRYPTVAPQRAKTAGQRVRPAETAKSDGQASGQDGSSSPRNSGEVGPKQPATPMPKPAPAGQLSLFQ